MKLYPVALTALLSIGVMSAAAGTPQAPRVHAAVSVAVAVPVAVAVNVTPRRLMPLDRATIAATFSTGRPDSGPYTATLELVQRGDRDGPTARQSGFRLRQGQPLTVSWEWRAGATLPPGIYRVRVRLGDGAGRIVATGQASAPLIVAGQSSSAG